MSWKLPLGEMDMQKELSLYAKSMGRIFRVRHVALSDADANNYCSRHPSTGVIACDTHTGIVYIADLNAIPVSSELLPE